MISPQQIQNMGVVTLRHLPTNQSCIALAQNNVDVSKLVGVARTYNGTLDETRTVLAGMLHDTLMRAPLGDTFKSDFVAKTNFENIANKLLMLELAVWCKNDTLQTSVEFESMLSEINKARLEKKVQTIQPPLLFSIIHAWDETTKVSAHDISPDNTDFQMVKLLLSVDRDSVAKLTEHLHSVCHPEMSISQIEITVHPDDLWRGVMEKSPRKT